MPPKQQPNLFDLYFEFVKDTESPLIFHRWSIIACVGAFLGRRFYFPHGNDTIYPNSYIMLIGNPGTRKSSAIKLSKKMLARTGYNTFAAEKTTKEKFLLDLEGLPENYGDYNGTGTYGRQRGRGRSDETISSIDVLRNLDLATDETTHDGTPRETFIAADEFNQFAGSGNLDFLSLLGSLWDWNDDTTTYKHRLKNSKSLSIYQPTISLLGGNTHTGLQEGFPIQTIGQGFMSRLLLVYSEPSGRKIAFPTKPPEELGAAVISFFKQIQTTVVGEASIAIDAKRALDMIYRTWAPIDDFRFTHYSNRRFTHLLKLLLIVTAARLSTRIDMQDVLLANTILTYAESTMSKALGEFGKSRNSEAAQNVMAALYSAKAPMPFEQLWKIVSRDLDKREQLTDILSGLLQAGKIQPPGKGAFAGFMALQKPVDSKALYVDFKLLREMEGK
jgi:hypothetical protein